MHYRLMKFSVLLTWLLMESAQTKKVYTQETPACFMRVISHRRLGFAYLYSARLFDGWRLYGRLSMAECTIKLNITTVRSLFAGSFISRLNSIHGTVTCRLHDQDLPKALRPFRLTMEAFGRHNQNNVVYPLLRWVRDITQALLSKCDSNIAGSLHSVLSCQRKHWWKGTI